ncbi:hypothetical protein HanOQP8_Chr16g0615661 [Helianthus annuus]|nr:hypothetical protein HanOQP8_Chr16g0615661 [Helianthus annuus]
MRPRLYCSLQGIIKGSTRHELHIIHGGVQKGYRFAAIPDLFENPMVSKYAIQEGVRDRRFVQEGVRAK